MNSEQKARDERYEQRDEQAMINEQVKRERYENEHSTSRNYEKKYKKYKHKYLKYKDK